MRGALAALIAAVLLPIIVAGAAFIAYQWRHQTDAAVARVQEHARAVQRSVDRELTLDLTLLNALATSRDIDAGDWRAFDDAARRAVRGRPGSWLVLYDEAGQTLVNTSVPLGTTLPNFRELASASTDEEWNGRTLPLPGAWLFAPFGTGQPSFSGIFFGPVNRGPVVASTVAVVRGRQRPYALAVAYGSEFFEKLLQAETPPGELTALYDQDGRFIARSLESARYLGREGLPSFRNPTASGQEVVGETTNMDGVRVVYARVRSAVAPGYVISVSVPKAVVLGPARRALWWWLGILSAAAAIGTFFAVRLWRRVGTPLAALARQARSAGEQRVDVPYTAIDEVEALREALEARSRAEEALRDAEQHYRTLAENAPEVIARFDRQLRHTYVNEYGASVYGVPVRDVIGKTNADLGMPAEKVAFWRRHLEEVFATGKQVTVDFDFESPAFGKQSFSSLFVPEKGARGEVTSVLAITRDITEQKMAEERFRAAVEELPTGLIVADLSTRALHWNKEALAIHGHDRETDVHRSLESILGEYELRTIEGEPIPVERSPLARLVAGESFRGYEIVVRSRRLGWERFFGYSGVVIRAAGRTPATALLAISDVTTRKRAEAALRESEAKFRTIFEQAAIGMGRVRFDDARWIDVNDAFCRMVGRSREEMLAEPWPAITHPDDVDLDLVPFRRMAAGELSSYAVEKRFIHRDGHHVWAKLTLSLVRKADGTPDYEIAIIEDIGDRKRAEEALRDADRRKDEFLGMLSHELRNPLAPIRNSLYILDRADPQGPQARRAKEVANRQVAHLTRLVDDLLDVTRIARGKIELRRTELDLGGLARRTAEDHRAVLEGRNLHLEVDVPDDPVIVHADETRLAQVVGNLLHNAAKFTPGGGRVTLAVRVEDGRAAIHLRDTGPGIAPEILPTVFEPFTQAKQTLARSEGGLGLGLALVKGLVELHGGEVGVHSTAGSGTEFVVTLPLAVERARTAANGARHAGTTRGPRRRVLVIDDNRDAAESLAQLVEMFGHDVQVAFDAFTALGKASHDLPDVVLCDIGLPGMDGYEFARQFRALSATRAVRLVAVSGYAQSEDVEKAVEAGFDAHVAKPADPVQIERLLS